MAIVKFIPRKQPQTGAGLRAVLSYCGRSSKTEYEGRRLVSGVNCLPASAYSEFMSTKLTYGKADGRLFYHLLQSFAEDERVTPATAHEIALKLAAHFEGYETLVYTHTDRGHIHSHFIINSVSYETGYKYHADREEIARIREKSDALCREYGLSVCQPRQGEERPMSEREYRSADKGQSWKVLLASQINEAMKYAGSKEHFMELMETEGYKVTWTDERKYITYTTPEGMKCRDIKLHEAKYRKENMERECELRGEILFGLYKTSGGAPEGRRHGGADGGRFRRQLEGDDQFPGVGDRGVEADQGRTADADHTKGNGGLPVLADPDPDRIHDESEGGAGILPQGIQPDAGGIQEQAEGRDEEFILTGWENERQIFLQYRSAVGAAAAVCGPAVPDRTSADDPLGLGVLFAVEAVSILDSCPPVEDCTTLTKKGKRKKHVYGPSMGGQS